MDYLLLVISATAGAMKSVLSRCAGKGALDVKGTFKRNALLFSVAFVCVLAYNIFTGKLAFAPVLLVCAYALVTLFSQVCLFESTGSGPVGISALFYSCGFVIPTVFGSVFYRESVNAFDVSGIILILISFVVSADFKGSKASVKWLVFALGGFLCSGVLGVLQKVFRMEYPSVESSVFAMNSLGVIALSCVVISCVFKIFGKDKGSSESEKTTPFTAVVAPVSIGVCMAVVNVLNTYLSGVLPSALVFPVLNGGAIFLSVLISSVTFKEKLSKKQIISLVTCAIAIGLIATGKAL